jgi:Mrp family chromosome partitioning ATPase
MASDDWRKSYEQTNPDDAPPPAEADDSGLRPSPTLERMKQEAAMAQRTKQHLGAIKHKLIVLSGKGGVGKSTVTVNLGWELALRDFTVGLLDADIHGPNLPLLLGVEGLHASATPEGIEPIDILPNLKVMSVSFLIAEDNAPVIWRGPIKGQLIKQFISDVDWGLLDWLIIDNPPGTGDEPLTVAQTIPDADGAIIVTLPQEVSLMDCRKAINFARAVGLRVLGVVENMSGFVCPHCNQPIELFGVSSPGELRGGEKMAQEMGVPFLGKIPMAAQVAAMGDAGQSLVGPMAPEGVREAYKRLTDRLLIEVASL